jgi:hypothetical protein
VLDHRHSWIWEILPPDSRLIWCEGDPALAEFLRELGFRVVENQPEGGGATPGVAPSALIIAGQGDAVAAAASRVDATVRGGGVVAAPVAGGGATTPGRASRAVRALQLAASPLAAISTEIASRRVARTLRRLGLRVSRVPTGDRVRTKYGLGPGGWIGRRRLPVGSIVIGARTEPSPSVIEVAADRAGQALGRALSRRSATAFESGKVAVDLRDSEGAAYYLWIAAGSAREALNRRRAVVQAIVGATPPSPLSDRILAPIDSGQVGPTDYVLEAKASGVHPIWLTRRLWQDSLEFLIALHRLPARAPALALEGGWPDLELAAEFLAGHVGSEERATLERVHREIASRVSDVPRGGGHGDFWRQNLIVKRGRLRAVVDWDWAARDSYPLLDLMDLIAHMGLRRMRATPLGVTFAEYLWPLAQRGGDDRVRFYCRETETPGDARTLEGLTMAHWLLRTARAGLIAEERLRYPWWFADNVRVPLMHLRKELGAF